jgi:hypothetical protein
MVAVVAGMWRMSSFIQYMNIYPCAIIINSDREGVPPRPSGQRPQAPPQQRQVTHCSL